MQSLATRNSYIPQDLEKNDPSSHVLSLRRIRDDLEVSNAPADRKIKLPRKNYSRKFLIATLPPNSFHNQIFVLCEQNPAERRRPIK